MVAYNCIIYIISITLNISFHSVLPETSSNIKNFQIRLKLVSEYQYFVSSLWILRSCRQDVFCEKGVLRNFSKITAKQLCQSLYFNKVTGQAFNFIKTETYVQVLSCAFCKISKNIFLSEHLLWLVFWILPFAVALVEFMSLISLSASLPRFLILCFWRG